MTTPVTPVVSVLGNFDAATSLFYNLIQSGNINRQGTVERKPDAVRLEIEQYETKMRQLYVELEKVQAKNAEAYLDMAMLNFSRTREEALKNKSIVDLFLRGSEMWIHYKDVHAYISELNSTYNYGDYLLKFDMKSCEFRVHSIKYFVARKKYLAETKAEVEKLMKQGTYPDGRTNHKIMAHPHVRECRPCLGNLTGMLAPILAQFRFNIAVEMLTGYMQATNMNDGWGRIGPAFPLISGPGIQKWSKELYPEMPETKWEYYVGYDYDGGGIPKSKETKDWWTTEQYAIFEVDQEAMIKCILQLPDQRRSVKDMVNENIIRGEAIEEVVAELIQISEQEAAQRTAAGLSVEYITGADNEGFAVQIPAIRQTANPGVPLGEQPQTALDAGILEAPVKKPRAPRKKKAA